MIVCAEERLLQNVQNSNEPEERSGAGDTAGCDGALGAALQNVQNAAEPGDEMAKRIAEETASHRAEGKGVAKCEKCPAGWGALSCPAAPHPPARRIQSERSNGPRGMTEGRPRLMRLPHRTGVVTRLQFRHVTGSRNSPVSRMALKRVATRSVAHPQTPPPSETEFRSVSRDETEFRHSACSVAFFRRRAAARITGARF